jgi:hypothetical protein
MAMDVAAFAKQLREDGINAAKIEGDRLIAEANTRAEAIRAEAEAAVAKMKQHATQEIAQHKARVDAELKLSARDLLLGVKREIEAIAALLLKGEVAKTLATEEVIKSALVELLRNQKTGTEWELALGPTVGKNLTEVVIKTLFKQEKAEVKIIDGLKQAGFELKSTKDARVLEVTEDSVTQAFRRLLSAELSAYLAAPKN